MSAIKTHTCMDDKRYRSYNGLFLNLSSFVERFGPFLSPGKYFSTNIGIYYKTEKLKLVTLSSSQTPLAYLVGTVNKYMMRVHRTAI